MSARGKTDAVRLRRARFLPAICVVAVCAMLAASARGLANPGPQSSQSSAYVPANAGQQSQASAPDSRIAHLPRGKKLILKDGSVQLVREYQVMDDRVRFYNTERSQWEEMPAALVDWDATKQSEADQKKNDAALLSSVHKQEQARRVMPLDVDASLEAAPGVFIPPGEGLFVYDGKSVLRLAQAQAENKLDKAKVVEQVLVPVPVVPSRRNLTIPRPHAEVRVHNEQPEFYMRTADGREPNMILIRTKVRSDSRLIENVDTKRGDRRALADCQWRVSFHAEPIARAGRICVYRNRERRRDESLRVGFRRGYREQIFRSEITATPKTPAGKLEISLILQADPEGIRTAAWPARKCETAFEERARPFQQKKQP
jgi:hypothetical protein